MRNIWNLVAHNRNFFLLSGANLISLAGDWILGIGMMFYVYTVTGSALASGAMLLVSMVPQLLFGSLAGVFVDRWDRKRTMVVTNLLLALALIPLFAVHDERTIWVVYVVVFVQGVLEQLFQPAEAAMVPHVVPAEDLVAANALNGQNRQVARLIGAAVGGVLAATGGIFLVTVVDAVSYLVAAALVAMIRAEVPPEPIDPAGDRRRLDHEWRAGIALCLARRDLTTLLVFRLMSGFGEGVLAVLIAPLIISVLHASSAEYGSVISVQAVGGIVGGLAIAAVGRRWPPRLLLGYGALMFGVVDLVIALYPLALPALWPIFILISVVGAPSAAQQAGFSTIQQTETPDRYRGRVFGALSTGWALAMLLGIVLASTLGDVVGIIAIISLQGVIHILAGPYLLVRLRPPLPEVSAGVAVPVVEDNRTGG
ncbi:MFS transporter [Amycolatopsis mediterranei]|nr:MFS transporter [Amycolatopsis mediterranei]